MGTATAHRQLIPGGPAGRHRHLDEAGDIRDIARQRGVVVGRKGSRPRRALAGEDLYDGYRRPLVDTWDEE